MVAEQQNWELRLKTENDSAKKWQKDWGPLYNVTKKTSYSEQIERLQAEIDSTPVSQELVTASRSYGAVKPVREIRSERTKIPKMDED